LNAFDKHLCAYFTETTPEICESVLVLNSHRGRLGKDGPFIEALVREGLEGYTGILVAVENGMMDGAWASVLWEEGRVDVNCGLDLGEYSSGYEEAE